MLAGLRFRWLAPNGRTPWAVACRFCATIQGGLTWSMLDDHLEATLSALKVLG